MVLRALWFRRGTSAAVLLVAAMVIGGAATAPLFLRAAGESVLRDTLRTGDLPGTRLLKDSVSSSVSQHPDQQVLRSTTRRLVRQPTLDRLMGPPVAGIQADAAVPQRGSPPLQVVLAWRDAECGHLEVVKGRCATGINEVMASELAAAQQSWHVGRKLVVSGRPMTVVGTYRPREALGDYWAGHPYFAPFTAPPSGSPTAMDVGLDNLFTTRATIEALPGATQLTATLDRRLRIDQLRLAEVDTLKRQLRSYGALTAAEVAAQGNISGLAPPVATSVTVIPSRLDQATAIASKLTAPVVVVAAQLLLLCWLVLFLVVANGAEARGPEIALAKLRGLPTASTVTFGLLDSLLLVALALPLGLVGAYVGVGLLARFQLAPGTPMAMTPTAVLAALVAAAGAAVAAVLAAVRTVRRPIVEQWRRATRQVRVRSWVVDAVAVVVAVAGVIVLLRSPALAGGRAPSTWALLAPGLVVLAAALVGSRVLPWLCRALFPATGRRRWLGAFLAVRQIARRPSTLRLALVLAVGVGLLTFAVDAWTVGRGNAHDRAWTEVGAARSLQVLTPPGQDLGDIVDRLDPSGRQAVAVSQIADYDTMPAVWLLAVQSQRFGHVAFWRDDFGPPLSRLSEQLQPPAAPLVQLDGEAVAVHVVVQQLTTGRPVFLTADVGHVGGGEAPVKLGRLHPGRQVLRGEPPCTRCFLNGLHLDRSPGEFYPVQATLRVTGVEVRDATGWHRVPADLRTSGQWRAEGHGAAASASGSGLLLRADVAHSDVAGWAVANRPPRFPALVTRAAQHAGAHGSIGGLDGWTVPITPISVGPALPGAGTYEVVLDRGFAVRVSKGVSGAQDMVWLSASAPTSFAHRLEQAGVTVLGETDAAEQTGLYERTGPQLALLLFVYGAGLAAVLAAGGCVLTSYLAGRRRTYEIVALLAQGLRSRTILVALVLEQALLLAFGILVGAVAGLIGAWLTLPAIPEFADVPTAPPLRYDVHWALLAGTLAVTVVVLGLVVAFSSLGLLRSSRFTQLREAPA